MRDYRNTVVRVAVRDAHMREHDALPGVVTLPLGEFFKTQSPSDAPLLPAGRRRLQARKHLAPLQERRGAAPARIVRVGDGHRRGAQRPARLRERRGVRRAVVRKTTDDAPPWIFDFQEIFI